MKDVKYFDFVKIPAGKFMMGSPSSEKGRFNDEYQQEVELSEFADALIKELDKK